MKFLRAGAAALVASLAVWASAPALRGADPIDSTPFLTGLTDPDAVTARLGAHLAAAQQSLDRLVAVKGPRTVENTLRLYDEVGFEALEAAGPANVLARLHPDEGMRRAGEAILVRARALEARKLEERAVYDALKSIDASRVDPETRYYLARELAAFRRNGVDKDPDTRARLTALKGQLSEAIADYRRNVDGTGRTVTLDGAAGLEGLPPDFIARHKPGVTGGITLRAENSDYPVLLFAKSGDVRRRLYMAFANIGYPENVEPLRRVIALRWEIAHLLGFNSWADYDAASRMVGTANAAADFIARAVREAKPEAAREYQEILKRKQQDVPGAAAIDAWEFEYYRELVRKANYDFDSQAVRPYFAYDRVKQGVLDVTSRMYGVTYRPAPNVPVWHPSIEVYDVLDGDRLIGRVYFDTHPRPNKQLAGGAATSVAHTGLAGREIPEVVVMANLPGGQPGDPGLLTYQNVRDPMFHEFGHAIHRILSGQPRWSGLHEEAEDDYREVTSQLFEQWAWDPSVLPTFARHYQTNEPIPAALVEKMRRASDFGKGMMTVGQLAFARYAFAVHAADPKSTDPAVLWRDIMTADASWLYADGTHREDSFTHIANTNYQSAYYSYYWGLVIAHDMLAQFDPTNLLAPGPAHRFRDVVLKPGGTRPAADTVREFLGRPFNEKAWSAWINRDPA